MDEVLLVLYTRHLNQGVFQYSSVLLRSNCYLIGYIPLVHTQEVLPKYLGVYYCRNVLRGVHYHQRQA